MPAILLFDMKPLPSPHKFTYRITRESSRTGTTQFNILAERRWHRFLWWSFFSDVILDFERIPSYVWISIATLGYDSSNWKSKWAGDKDISFQMPTPKPSPLYGDWIAKFEAEMF